MKSILEASVPFFSRRAMAAAVYHEKLYYFGGVGANGSESILDVTDELWSFNTLNYSWKKIEKKKIWPSPRRCVGWATKEEEILLWGGSGLYVGQGGGPRHNFLNDTWSFSPVTETWNCLYVGDDHFHTPLEDPAIIAPFPRYTPVFHIYNEKLFLHGGYTEDRLGKRKLNDLWLYDGGHWREKVNTFQTGYKGNVKWPGVRYGSMSTRYKENIYMCGGFSDAGDHIDLWKFDLDEEKWYLLAADKDLISSPEPRYCAAFAIFENSLFLFGGRSRQNPKLNFNDLWMFDLQLLKWKCLALNNFLSDYTVSAKFPAYHAKASVTQNGRYFYILGGEGLHGHVSDFWRFDMRESTWELIQPAREDDPIFW